MVVVILEKHICRGLFDLLKRNHGVVLIKPDVFEAAVGIQKRIL
jgi:hypothetical protein